ncbi:MAG: AAA domain-containing protein [Bacillota bacterium]
MLKELGLVNNLKSVAPVWAELINGRTGIHGQDQVPGDPELAWIWKQLSDELDRRNQDDIKAIQVEINYLDKEIKSLTGKLVEKKAWKEKLLKITTEQTQAIEGWRHTIRNIGRGTGKRVPKLLAKARELMTKSQAAVPVWIMPLSKVAENFNPQKNKFDVVIIDEASQADIMSLCAVYLGKEIVIVGDDEQVSPMSIGQKIEEEEKLIETLLMGIPNNHLYTGRFSIYDLAQTSGFQPICLREHFRCLSPIIQFSNHLSYDGKIKPLRDDSTVKVKPATVAYRVDNAFVENKKNINIKEAQAVASLLIACTHMEEYKGMTFGVISMVGEDQAVYINGLLQEKMSPAEYVNRRIQCGNPAHFQGDERDVMFLSMVDAPTGEGPLGFRPDPGNMFKKRFNVAASRACNQMWVVHSLNPEIDLKDGDIRLRLIKHAENPTAIENRIEQVGQETESEFEKLVATKLIEKGYKVIPQWKVGSFRIDMVVEGNGKRLAIECDGERWHKPWDLDKDMARQAVLERLGWRFERIRGSEFFRDEENAMGKVYRRLEELEIPPVFNSEVEEQEVQCDLQERVIKKAFELQREWGWIEAEDASIDADDTVSPSKDFDAEIFKESTGDYNQSDNIDKVEVSATLEEINTSAEQLSFGFNEAAEQIQLDFSQEKRAAKETQKVTKKTPRDKNPDKRKYEGGQPELGGVLDFRNRKKDKKATSSKRTSVKTEGVLDFRKKR